MIAAVGFEPHDLRVMSPTSYQTALPRDINVFGQKTLSLYTLFHEKSILWLAKILFCAKNDGFGGQVDAIEKSSGIHNTDIPRG